MRRHIVTLIATVVVAGVAAVAQPAIGQAGRSSRTRVVKAGALDPQGQYVAGEVVVAFRSGVARTESQALHARLGSTVVERIDLGPRIEVVRAPAGVSVPTAASRYARLPKVKFAEPNWLRYASFTPNDTRFTDLWALHNTSQLHPVSDSGSTNTGTLDADIDATGAWNQVKGEDDTVIAVIDTGVQTSHPDLAANVWTNTGEIPGNSVDDDGNGFQDDVHGWDFVNNDNTPSGGEHGTHVAGTIAGVTNNGVGISGICGGDSLAAEAGCSIMPLRFIGPGGGALSDELAAIAYARENGADIINGSFGGGSWSALERNAIKQAGAEEDILSVFAAGNDSLDNDMATAWDFFGGPALDTFSPSYPASYNLPRIISVAASNDDDRYGYGTACEIDDGHSRSFCAFSNFGRFSVDLAAPGVDILSTVPANSYETWDGTSMAAPHVSGVAGLLESNDGALSALDIKNMIMDGTETTGLPLNSELDTFLSLINVLPLPNGPQAGRFTRTAGRLNSDAALTGSTADASPTHDGDIPGAMSLGANASTSVNWPNDVNDVYKKQLLSGRRYRIRLEVPPGRDFDLYLEKPGTVEIWQAGSVVRASFQGTGTDEAITIRPTQTKLYFIHVSSWFTDGGYTLRVRCLTC